jgi:hypothetical protein
MLVDRLLPLNCIDDIMEPVYSKEAVYIDIEKIKRSKLDIKLRFKNVNDTSGYSGNWFITRRKALSFRKKFNNNGISCVVIPFEEFEKLEIAERSLLEL